MAKIQIIRKGGSLDFTFDLAGESLAGWVLVIKVKQFPDDTASISRTIAGSDDKWTGFLTSTETAALAVGSWWLTAIITNATTDEERQIPERFQVVEDWNQ